jgi:hypothetical protein
MAVDKRKRQGTELKITLPARPSSKPIPVADYDFGNSADEFAADPLAADDPLATDDNWSPPPVSSISEDPPLKKHKSTINRVQQVDSWDNLGDPGTTSDADLSDSSISLVTALPVKPHKKPGPKTRAKKVEEPPKPEDLSELSS